MKGERKPVNSIVLANNIKRAVGIAKTNAPIILTAITNLSTISAVIFGVRATPKAVQLIREAEEKKGDKLNTGELIKTTWKLYVPAAVFTALSVASSVGATRVSLKRNATLAGLYSASELAMKEYQEKVVDTVGKEKKQEIDDKVATDKAVEAAKTLPYESVIDTGRGHNLYFDSFNGRFFRSCRNEIDRACLDVKDRLINGKEMLISVNELWSEMGLPQTDSGNEFGFTPDNPPEFYYSYLPEVYGEECASVTFSAIGSPKYEYYKLY